jgi:hypothetical protein
MAGKRARCQACQAVVTIPALAATAAPPAAPVYPASVPQSPPPAPLRTHAASPFANPSPPQPVDPEMDRRVEMMQKLTDSAASNPGRLRISMLKHWLSFPAWPTGWAVGFTIALALAVLLHWGFACLAVPLAALNWLYWWVQRNKFASGCVNPTVVLSVDPPLVAVLTNLTKGATETKWDYVKVLPQPLGSMTAGPPQLGQKLASVAVYEDSNNDEHWHDFYPVVVNCVSWNQADIARVQSTIDPGDWKELDAAIRQLPQPPVEGLYKVELHPAQRRTPPSRDELNGYLDACLPHAPDKGSFHAAGGIPPHLLQAACLTIAPGVNGNDVLAVVQASGDSSGQTGLVIATPGLFFRLSDQIRGAVRWTDLWGAGSARDGLEIMLRNGQRWRFGKEFGDHAVPLEALLDGIAKSDEPALG